MDSIHLKTGWKRNKRSSAVIHSSRVKLNCLRRLCKSCRYEHLNSLHCYIKCKKVLFNEYCENDKHHLWNFRNFSATVQKARLCSTRCWSVENWSFPGAYLRSKTEDWRLCNRSGGCIRPNWSTPGVSSTAVWPSSGR